MGLVAASASWVGFGLHQAALHGDAVTARLKFALTPPAFGLEQQSPPDALIKDKGNSAAEAFSKHAGAA